MLLVRLFDPLVGVAPEARLLLLLLCPSCCWNCRKNSSTRRSLPAAIAYTRSVGANLTDAAPARSWLRRNGLHHSREIMLMSTA
jgi:hypothetical protein